MKYIKELSEAERQTLPDAWDQLGLLGLHDQEHPGRPRKGAGTGSRPQTI